MRITVLCALGALVLACPSRAVTGAATVLTDGDFLDFEASPDGSHVAVLKDGPLAAPPGLDASTEFRRARSLRLLNTRTGSWVDPPEAVDISTSLLGWSADSSALLVSVVGADRFAAQERAAQEEAERRARAGRVVAIREAAWAALNGEAEGWLSSPLAPGAACAIRMSEQSDEGLGAALGALRRHVAELEEAARKAMVIGGFQARLRQAAGASFEPARAEFFLNNRRPELGMATPLAHCVDERSLREAMSLLGSRSKR